MLTAVLLLAAGLLVGRDWILEQFRRLAESDYMRGVEGRHLLSVVLVAAAAVVAMTSGRKAEDGPAPQPGPPAAFSLDGLFIGPTASADAASMAGLCDEIADCLEHDGMRPQPRLTSGAAFDDLRVAAREARMKGESIGARQPHVRDAVHKYLDDAVGTSGGPVGPPERAKWVSAYREIARAAADVSR